MSAPEKGSGWSAPWKRGQVHLSRCDGWMGAAMCGARAGEELGLGFDRRAEGVALAGA